MSAEARERLADERPGVRRLAVLDLIAAADADPSIDGLLLEHLERERDERAAAAIVRRLARARYRPARPLLWRLYADRSTPVALAHAAILAHDAIELTAPRAGPPPGV